jgi:hypothetical protein
MGTDPAARGSAFEGPAANRVGAGAATMAPFA